MTKTQAARWRRHKKRDVMRGYHEGMDSDALVFICQLYNNLKTEGRYV